MSIDPVVEDVRRFADEEAAVCREDIVTFSVQVAKSYCSVIAALFVSGRGIGAMDNGVASLPHGEKRLPYSSNDV